MIVFPIFTPQGLVGVIVADRSPERPTMKIKGVPKMMTTSAISPLTFWCFSFLKAVEMTRCMHKLQGSSPAKERMKVTWKEAAGEW